MKRVSAMRIFYALVAIASAFVLTGCEQVFTTSVFSSFQRDPANLPPEQQQTYARNALSSGNTKQMKNAYDSLEKSLEGNTDPELNKLAADLAVGASGMNDVLSDLTAAATSGNVSDPETLGQELNDKLNSIDYEYVNKARAQIEAAETNDGDVTEDQYLTVAAGMAMEVGSQSDGKIENIDSDSEEVQNVKNFVDSGVQNTGAGDDSILKQFSDALNNL